MVLEKEGNKVDNLTEEVIDRIAEKYKDEAVKNAVAAFNDGYLLGVQHAKTVYGGQNEQD